MAKREIEHDVLPIPNGWFAVEWSRDLHEGDVKPIHYFGEDLVLFRTRSGEARILDAYCPHLGAHLGFGGRARGRVFISQHRLGYQTFTIAETINHDRNHS